MSFREKRAWVSFFILLLIGGSYFLHLHLAYRYANGQTPEGSPSLHFLVYLALGTLLVFVLIEIILYVVLRLQSPKEARTPKDEREILFELKSIRAAYSVLIIFAILAALLIVMHSGGDFSWLMGNAVILAIVIAQLVKYAAQIYYYRR